MLLLNGFFHLFQKTRFLALEIEADHQQIALWR